MGEKGDEEIDMKDNELEKRIARRERGYIWMEERLKGDLLKSTAGIAVFFIVLYGSGLPVKSLALLFPGALLVNGIWHYLIHRRNYRDYLVISRYLEEFEDGRYECQGNSAFLNTGIQSQIVEQMIRLGTAFGTLKERLVEEKENTKRLVTDISHQLKTPAAALKLCFELLEDDALSLEERQEFLKRGGEEVRKFHRLTETLFNLSKMEAEMIRLQVREGSLKETLIRAVNGVWIRAGEKDMAIEMQEFQDITIVHDARWTAEAVSNVLDNAVKYSPGGSVIRIRVESMASCVFIEVEDEGIGIPKKEYPEIFKRFYRGHGSEVESQEGAGVGLYLVRRILEGQGGSVRALPGQSGGTIIQMMLPKQCRTSDET